MRQESEHHIRLGSTHQQKRKGGIIHDTTPADAAVKHEEGAKIRRSRHVHVHDHGEQKGTTRRELTLQHAGREKAVQLLQQQQQLLLLLSMRHVISMRLAKSRCTGKWRK